MLRVDGLGIRLTTPDGDAVDLVRDVSFEVAPGRTTALVGASGCGKSLSTLAVPGLLPPRMTRSSGTVEVGGRRLTSPRDHRAVRGRRVGMIFQEPTLGMNPARAVGDQIADAARACRGLSRGEARRAGVAWLERVGISEAPARARDYPHRFSGGQLQRIMIALALVGEPDYLLADEPTSNLDVTVQGRILGLLRRLQRETGLGVLLVTHDLRVVRAMTEEVVLMERGGPAGPFAGGAAALERALAEAEDGRP